MPEISDRASPILDLARGHADSDNREDAFDQDVIDLSEDGLAAAFAARHKETLRYCHSVRAWYRWDGAIWKREQKRLAYHLSRILCRDLAHMAGGTRDKRLQTGKASTAASVERFAQADPTFAVTHEIWDVDPFLLGTPDGTVDLRTGTLRPSQKTDFITKSTSVTPARTPNCPLWRKFLDEATGGDHGFIRFIQQFFGYA